MRRSTMWSACVYRLRERVTSESGRVSFVVCSVPGAGGPNAIELTDVNGADFACNSLDAGLARKTGTKEVGLCLSQL